MAILLHFCHNVITNISKEVISLKLMKKLVFPGPYQIEFQQQSLPVISTNQVLVATDYSLISPGTELALYTGTHTGLSNPNNSWAKYPFSPGYAIVGRVIAVGSEITEFHHHL
jgi:NADPH:quinone reductase-like Zn-dependent oxidoreductase